MWTHTESMCQISVCIPTYNSARYLPEAIESVFAQDYGAYELVVCDNASNDGTQEVCARYGDPRFRYLRFDNHVGQAANWNRCLREARGDLVVLLHADDALYPTFLGRAATVLMEQKEVVFVHSAVEHVDAEGRPLFVTRLFPEHRLLDGEEVFRTLLLEGCVVNPAGTMVRRTAYQRVGLFTEAVVWGVDWHMWLRLSLEGTVAYLAHPLARYREHAESGTASVIASARVGPDERCVIEDIFSNLPEGRSYLRDVLGEAWRASAHRTWCQAEVACRRGLGVATRRGIAQAVRTDPTLLGRSHLWALWAASYLGYAWFEHIQRWKHRVVEN